MNRNLDLYKEILDHLYEGVYFVDIDRTITYWNKAAERITGYTSNEVVGKHCYKNILKHVDEFNNQLCLNGCPLYHTIHDGSTREAGVYLQHKQGHRVLAAVRTIPVKVNGEIIGAVEVFVDDREKAHIHNTINELKELVLSDALTGLPNRRYIDSFLDSRFAEYKKLNIPFALAMIDIDNFRIFNDTYGHDTGDEVLKLVAMTMKNAIRRNDMVGRWGGEEFLAILVGVSSDDLIIIIEKVRTLVERSALPYNDDLLRVTVSIGITMVQEDDTTESIQKRADKALYMSKNGGRNQTTML